MSHIITRIYAEAGRESCEVGVDVLHETLLQLPAEKYIELYRKMQLSGVVRYVPYRGPSAEEGMRIAGFSEEFIEGVKKNA